METPQSKSLLYLNREDAWVQSDDCCIITPIEFADPLKDKIMDILTHYQNHPKLHSEEFTPADFVLDMIEDIQEVLE